MVPNSSPWTFGIPPPTVARSISGVGRSEGQGLLRSALLLGDLQDFLRFGGSLGGLA